MNALTPYIPICEAVVRLVPGRLEAVLHDLSTGRVVYIASPFSKRNVGDPSLINESWPPVDGCADIIGPYAKYDWDGARLKSISVVLRNAKNTPIGLLCLNMRVGDLDAAAEILAVLTSDKNIPAPVPLVEGDWRETTNRLVARELQARQISINIAKRDDRVAILIALLDAGVLQVRGSADYIAQILKISRASLYADLKTARRAKSREADALAQNIHGDADA